ncbi:TrkH family potassium uptake protein [Atopobacter sp. AH10]|uniref:TrkH family potassium uptake protein n=1 Tax=Atopobacter sp. AH10 TaxID=2315861 RepID=UPI000EF2805F|nr:TrkH family potassium uptake protein [Atopobacter sp. AH10]RLK64174.1 TrkH family potassium uptake protein [Atopobacter sp. AH10]
MSYRTIRYFLGLILIILALLLSFPLLVSVVYGETLRFKLSFLFSMAIAGGLGFLLQCHKPKSLRLYAREGGIIVALGWLLLSFFGALPFVFSGDIPHLVDAYFETASGFTTTGASIVHSVDDLARSTLFWRSFTHFIGGMGFLVFTLAIVSNSGSDSVHLMKAEVPGPVFGKLVARLRTTAQILYGIYLALTAILVVILLAFQVPFYDALLLAFGTAGTGGFGIRDIGLSAYANPEAVEYILGIFMLIFGVNFNLYYLILIKHLKEVYQDEELRAYVAIVTVAIVAIFLNVLPQYQHWEPALRNIFFTVSSIITTTGYSTANFDKWPMFSKMILLLLMFVGGCAGSTAGGLKVSRIVLYFKTFVAELRRGAHPNRIVILQSGHRRIDADYVVSVSRYLIVYTLLFNAMVLILTLDAENFLTAFSAVAATLNNIGPGFEIVGPTRNYASLNDLSKFVLSIGMIAGRLELYPILVLFSPLQITFTHLPFNRGEF